MLPSNATASLAVAPSGAALISFADREHVFAAERAPGGAFAAARPIATAHDPLGSRTTAAIDDAGAAVAWSGAGLGGVSATTRSATGAFGAPTAARRRRSPHHLRRVRRRDGRFVSGPARLVGLRRCRRPPAPDRRRPRARRLDRAAHARRGDRAVAGEPRHAHRRPARSRARRSAASSSRSFTSTRWCSPTARPRLPGSRTVELRLAAATATPSTQALPIVHVSAPRSHVLGVGDAARPHRALQRRLHGARRGPRQLAGRQHDRARERRHRPPAPDALERLARAAPARPGARADHLRHARRPPHPQLHAHATAGRARPARQASAPARRARRAPRQPHPRERACRARDRRLHPLPDQRHPLPERHRGAAGRPPLSSRATAGSRSPPR